MKTHLEAHDLSEGRPDRRAVARPLDHQAEANQSGRAARSQPNGPAVPPAQSKAPRREGVQVIARAAEMMRLLAASSEGLTHGQLAERVNLPRSTVHRIVGALDAEGFVRPAPSGKLRLGPALIGLVVSSRQDLRHEAAPYLERLSHELHETVDLAVLDGGQVLFIDQYTSRRQLRIVSEIGARFPLYCTANGKALLAELPLAEVERLVPEELPALTENTLTTREKLLAELTRARTDRLAFDCEEHTLGISAVGSVVKDAVGNMAAFTVVMPTARFEGHEDVISKAVLRTREEIQAALHGG
ncbi:MAG: IclR family transcriptional regulator [Thermoleophilia bacterium]|nr:IclR family transcriptional regulator [Thermoleophilia bacterium]